MKRRKSGNLISDSCSPAWVSGEELTVALGTEADSSWIVTAPPDQPETSMRPTLRHVTRKEQIKPGRQQSSTCPREMQRGQLSETRIQFLGNSLSNLVLSQEAECLSLNPTSTTSPQTRDFTCLCLGFPSAKWGFHVLGLLGLNEIIPIHWQWQLLLIVSSIKWGIELCPL